MNASPTSDGNADDSREATVVHGPVLSLRGISKSYSGILALSSVNLDVHAGEAIGLIGQNGAGKSTIIRIISGAETPTAGTIEMNGDTVRFHSPADSRASGIHTIYQELSVVPHLTVAENVFLSDLPHTGLAVSWSKLRRAAKETLASLGFSIDVDARVGDLPLSQRQAVEIAKAVHSKARVILLDEPTATLPPPDVEKLFDLLRALKKDGVAIIYISHRLDEIYDVCDRITVLRDGVQIETRTSAALDPGEAVRLMIGDRLIGGFLDQTGPGRHRRLNSSPPTPSATPALQVSSLSDGGLLNDISFRVAPGEAVAVAGLVGSGQPELAASIFGSRARSSGRVSVYGRELPPSSPRATIRAGVGWLPEERKIQGLVLGMSIEKNLTLTALRKVSRFGYLRKRSERKTAMRTVDSLAIKCNGVGQKVGTLSGGNQQKVVFGKWLLADTRVMLLSEPTRGIDVGAKEEIYREMRNFLASGGSILVLSSEPEEALMCDRIYVLARGRVVGEMTHEEINHDSLVALLR